MRKRRRLNKFGAVRVNGFASKLENAVHEVLLLRQRAGEIEAIEKQVKITFTGTQVSWRVDFRFIDKASQKHVYAEAKGRSDAGYLVKKKLWKTNGFGRLEIWKGTYLKPKLDEIIETVGVTIEK